jgi:hypothetical protein
MPCTFDWTCVAFGYNERCFVSWPYLQTSVIANMGHSEHVEDVTMSVFFLFILDKEQIL